MWQRSLLAASGTATTLLVVYSIMATAASDRQERAALVFTRGGSIGYLLAIAIPLLVPGRNIYLSHNFEANYGVPTNETQYFLWYQRFKATNFNLTEAIANNRRLRRDTGFSRTYFYGQLMERMDLYGLNGTGCMQRMVCEMRETPVGDHNGVFGDVIEAIFSPSSSVDEDFPAMYYEAESSGANEGCDQYRPFCAIDLLGLVSIVLEV